MNFKLFFSTKLTYAGLSSAIDDSSDSWSDWTEDVDDADDGRNKMGTDPWAQESVMGVTGSEWDSRQVLLELGHCANTNKCTLLYWDSKSCKLTSKITGRNGSCNTD